MLEKRSGAEDAAWVPQDIKFGTTEHWSECFDSQGRSTRSPEHLKALFNPDQMRREAAMSELYTTLFHQGVRFRASIKAVPILLDIAERGECPSLAFVLEYLTALAYGYTAEIGPDGVNPARRMEALREEASIPSGERNPCDSHEPLCEPAVALELYDLIQQRRDVLAPLLYHQDQSVVAHALIAMALLCADDASARSRVLGRLERSLDGEAFEVQAAAMIAVGAMARAADDSDLMAQLERIYQTQDQKLRFLTAIGLAAPETIDTYREALTWGLIEWRDMDAPSVRAVWTTPSRLASERIAQCLKGADDGRLGQWVEGFARSVEQSGNWSSHAAAAELLRLICPQEERCFCEFAARRLTLSQRRGLEALRDASLWRDGDEDEPEPSGPSAYLSYVALLKTCGLPASATGLAAYVSGDGPPDLAGPI